MRERVFAQIVAFLRLVRGRCEEAGFRQQPDLQRQEVSEDSRHRQHHIDSRSAELLQRNKARAAQAAVGVEARLGADQGEGLADRHALALEVVRAPEDDRDGFWKRMAVGGVAREDASACLAPSVIAKALGMR